METIRILLVDDHQLVLDGLRSMLQQEMDMQVVGEAASVEEALTQMDSLSPEVILMDIKMPGMNGIDGTRKLRKEYPSCSVIMHTLYGDYLTEAIEAGAVGFLLKGIHHKELAMAIRGVHLCQTTLFHKGSPFTLVKL